MVGVLEYLQGLTLPPDMGEVTIDWDGPLGQVKDHLLPEHFLCPCECLFGTGNEVQHHDGLLGEKRGPVGESFANAIARQADAYNNMQALMPNLAPPIRTAIITKVGTTSMSRVLQLWGAAQEGVAVAVTEAYEHGWFPNGYHDTHVIVVAVFVHPFAGLVAPTEEGGKWNPKNFLKDEEMERSMHGIGQSARVTTLGMLADGLTGGLTPQERIERYKTTRHPFRGYEQKKPAPAVI